MIRGLPLLEDGLDEDAHVAFGRIPAAHNAEPEAFSARAFFEQDAKHRSRVVRRVTPPHGLVAAIADVPVTAAAAVVVVVTAVVVVVSDGQISRTRRSDVLGVGIQRRFVQR